MQENKFSPLTWKIAALTILVIFVLLGYFLYEREKGKAILSTSEELANICEFKAHEVAVWRKELLMSAREFQRDSIVANRSKTAKDFETFLKTRQAYYKYQNIIAVDRNFAVRARLDDAFDLSYDEAQSLAQKALTTGNILLSDIHIEKIQRSHVLDIFVPIPEGGIPSGVLILRCNADDFLNNLSRKFPRPSETAEAMLVRKVGGSVVYMSDQRFKKDTSGDSQYSNDKKSLESLTFKVGKGFVEAFDYRQEDVLAYIQAIPNSEWYLIAKIDSSEVSWSVRKTFFQVIAIFGLLLVLAGLSAGYVWRNQQTTFFKKQYESEMEREALAKHFEYLTRNANDIILMMDENWKIVESNDRAIQIYQYSRRELLNMGFGDLSADDSVDLTSLMRQLVKRDGQMYETVHRCKSRSLLPVEISARAIMVKNKVFIQAIIRDITQRKQTETELRNSEIRYRSLFESARDGIIIVDADRREILNVNLSLIKMLGYPREEYLWKDITEVTPFKSLSELMLREMNKEEYIRSAVLPVETREGGHLDLELISNIYYANNRRMVQFNFRDITERKKAEQLLFESEKKYREMVNFLPIPILETDVAGTLISANNSFHDYFGRGKDNGKLNIHELILDADKERADEDIKRILCGDNLGASEYFLVKKDGSSFPALIFTNRISSSDEIVGMRGAILDVTEIKQAEEKLKLMLKELKDSKDMLIQSEKLAAIGTLSAGVAHEVLNPLNIINMRLQMLELTETLSNKAKESYKIIKSQIERISKILKNLSQFSRITEKQMAKADLKEVIEYVNSLIMPRLKLEKILFDFQYEEGIPPVVFDKFRIEQVFLNIFNNAIDAMGKAEKKCLRISASLEKCDGAEKVLIRFSDTGSGLKPENMSRMFEPFFTTKETGKGTGLGLSICYGIITDHNGRIWADNNEDGGASFFIELPVSNE
ncbi:MAG: PAS domain S-box protein [Syntrophaceae bacterium]